MTAVPVLNTYPPIIQLPKLMVLQENPIPLAPGPPSTGLLGEEPKNRPYIPSNYRAHTYP